MTKKFIYSTLEKKKKLIYNIMGKIEKEVDDAENFLQGMTERGIPEEEIEAKKKEVRVSFASSDTLICFIPSTSRLRPHAVSFVSNNEMWNWLSKSSKRGRTLPLVASYVSFLTLHIPLLVHSWGRKIKRDIDFWINKQNCLQPSVVFKVRIFHSSYPLSSFYRSSFY